MSDPRRDLAGAVWRKSSRTSPHGQDCVEVARNIPGIVAVRDSKNPDGPKLVFGHTEWRGFIASVRSGRLDR